MTTSMLHAELGAICQNFCLELFAKKEEDHHNADKNDDDDDAADTDDDDNAQKCGVVPAGLLGCRVFA